jgi:hypothetical protein
VDEEERTAGGVPGRVRYAIAFTGFVDGLIGSHDDDATTADG